MRPHISSDEAHRIAFGFSPPDGLYFATRLRDGLGERGARPAGQGPSGNSAPGKQRIRSASGHAAGNAGQMGLAVSTTRAAIVCSSKTWRGVTTNPAWRARATTWMLRME